MTRTLENIKKGKSSEFIFSGILLKKGMTVCLPLCEDNDYDFIVDNTKDLKTVQVRSIHKIRSRVNKKYNCLEERYKINFEKNKKYDILVIHIQPEDKWYIIPKKDIKDISCIAFNYSTKTTGSKYDKYLNNWEILL